MAEKADQRGARVPGGQLFFARFMAATGGFWERLGNLETRVLGSELASAAIRAPIYVTGLARAGTTIVTEMLAAHPEVTSHHYSDFPPVWTPYWWNALRARLPLPQSRPQERAHRDRLEVTPDSPEAVEEVLWMRFFPHAHDPGFSQVLGKETSHERFENFYRDHLRKLLQVRGRKRYLAKGNYNLTRLGYLQKLFPDARFIIVVRDPEWHVASLMKQDRLFTELHGRNPKVTRYMKLLGHFEFGVHKHPINTGDAEAVRTIQDLWAGGDAVAGWARYWNLLHEHVLERLDADEALAAACLVVPFESLCHDSPAWIDRIIRHCGLPGNAFDEQRTQFAQRLSPPDYYRPEFSGRERRQLEAATRETHRRLLARAEQ